MGNTQSGYPLTRTAAALDSFVAELGSDIVYEKSLGTSRFLKTVRCRHRNGYLVAKIFIKPDPGMTLRKYQRRLKSACSPLLVSDHVLRLMRCVCCSQSNGTRCSIYRTCIIIRLLWRRKRRGISSANGSRAISTIA